MTQKARNISVFFRVFPWLKTQFVKSGEIFSSVYDYELLENSLEQDHEVRGW